MQSFIIINLINKHKNTNGDLLIDRVSDQREPSKNSSHIRSVSTLRIGVYWSDELLEVELQFVAPQAQDPAASRKKHMEQSSKFIMHDTKTLY
jgi:hypothetical protein